MPIEQWLAFPSQAVGAGGRQPFQFVELGRVELDAVGHQRLSPGVVRAGAIAPVEQLARDVGGKQLTRFLILQLVKAAAPAPVASAMIKRPSVPSKPVAAWFSLKPGGSGRSGITLK